MSELILPRRRRPLWTVFIAPVLVLVAAIAWSGFWFFAASKVDEEADAWRAREAKSGRVYDCAKRSVAGFPFRLEVRCDNASVALTSQTAGPQLTPISVRLPQILVVAQVYDPKLLIAEFTAPAAISESGSQPSLVMNWRLAQSSVYGLPAVPQRVALVFDQPRIDRISRSVQTPFASAKHAELHARLAEGSALDHPVIETDVQLSGASLQDVHPLLAKPFDAEFRVVLRGLKDVSPKPWPARFRELQATGGRADITQSRIQQGDMIAVAAGSLGLTSSGHLDGELQMTVAGLETVIPALGIEKMLEDGVPQTTLDKVAPGVKSQDLTKLFGALDRAMPGLGNVVRKNANAGLAAGFNSLGTATTLEGKKARTFPLRFVDGAVFLGPIKVAQTPPLF